MTKQRDPWEGNPVCYACGRLASKRGEMVLAGIKCRTWECECGESFVHPGDAEKALAANKLRHGIELKVGELNKAPYVRFTKEFSSVLHKGAVAVASLVSPNEIRLKLA